ncbi:hypothetical protein QYE76_003906 [Lolium multiflorum]|uniref:Uncharacterized protein n=1 Tax=Lolium multiflorum TaxID=4521 RepID=A0AAD8RTF7_LOLMU|nr:hypothetical protein QYE76_003906 [Lolium multiflorum]
MIICLLSIRTRHDELKAILEADLIGAFEKTRSHGIKFKGFQPEGALDGLDLSLPSDERTRALRQEVNYAVAHSLHRHAESLVNTLERVALNVVQEVMKHKYSPSGPALGTHQGEIPLYTRPPLQHTFAAPQQQGSPAYVVYKVGGDPGDYQFLYEPPKEIPHGYVCTYVPDCNNWMTQVTAGRTATAGGVAGAGSSSGADAEKQAWLTKYATSTSHERATSAAPTVDEITAIMRDQFGILPKKRMIGYSKPYPNDYDLIPLPPKYRLPDFTKFSGSEGTSSIEHVSRYLAQLGMVSASDELRVRFFSQSLTGPAFGWYTSLLPDSVRTWKQLEEQFHDKYKRVALIETDEDEDSAGDQEVAVAEWTRGAKPVSCKWVKQPGPVKGFDFDLSKTEQIFDLLLKEKQLKLPEGHKIPTPQEMNGRPYCKWHHTFTHTTNDCKVLRGQIQMAIEQGRLLFGQFAMRVDTQPFPEVNMVDLSQCIGREPGFSFDINMAGLADRHGDDKPESSRSRGKGEEEADPHDRPQTMKSGESSVSITMEKEADSSDRLKPTSTCLLPVRDMDLAATESWVKGQALADLIAERINTDVAALSVRAWTMFFDGSVCEDGCGIGMLLVSPRAATYSFSIRLSTPCTNNVAEYEAICKGMELLLDAGAEAVEIFGDSKLVISQLTEEYKCESESLFPLWMQCRELMAQFRYINFHWIPRTQNTEANDLAQTASGYKDVVEEADFQVQLMEPDDWRADIFNYLKDPARGAPKRIRYRAMKYVLIGDDMFYRTLEGLLLKCLGPAESNRLLHEACQRFGSIQMVPASAMNPIIKPWPFRGWGMDMIGKIHPPSSKGHVWVLAITDYFTKWVEAVPMKAVNASDVVDFVKEHVIHRFGIPQTITTDGGSVFVSKEFRKFCDDMGIKSIRSSPYYAQANGQAEASNKSLIKLIKRKIDENPRRWHEVLSEALWAYRMSCHGAIKTSPYHLVYGQEAVLPWEIQAGSRRVTFQNDLTTEEYAALMSDSIEDATELRLWSLEKIKENKAKVARAYNKKVKPKEFQVGDLVWEAVLPLGTKDKMYGKWSPNWHGPYKVDQVLKGNAYMLEQLDGRKFPVAVNGQHLKKYFPSMWDDEQ